MTGVKVHVFAWNQVGLRLFNWFLNTGVCRVHHSFPKQVFAEHLLGAWCPVNETDMPACD